MKHIQIYDRLSMLLAQIKAGYNLYKTENEIRQTYLFYRHKTLTNTNQLTWERVKQIKNTNLILTCHRY